MNHLRNLSRGFAAGALGGLANVVFIVIAGALGITVLLGINAPAPALPAFLYKQITWGGLWGLLLVAPFLKNSWWQRGLLLGLAASLVALFIVFPAHTTADGKGPGLLGLNAGTLMPLLVLLANSVWGLVAAYWYERTS